MKRNQIHSRPRAGFSAAVISGLFLLGAAVPDSPAVDRTWNGAGDGITMSSAANWAGGVAPVAGTDGIIFDGTTGTNIFNDYPGGDNFPAFAGVTFAASAGPFTISGNPISIALNTGITNYSSNLQYFAAAIEHNGAPHVYNLINGPMRFDVINGRNNARQVIKDGANEMILTGIVDNNGTVFVVTNGLVTCNKTGPLTTRAIGGTVPSTIYTNATVRIAVGSSLDQIFARVRMNMLGGTFQLQNTNEAIAGLAGGVASSSAIVENGLAGTTNLLTFGDENNHRMIYYGTIRDGAAGVLSIRVARNTVQQLHGNLTYSGTTTVDNTLIAGTSRLIVNGTHVGGGDYSVFGHPTTTTMFATLNGSGIISASAMNFGIRGVLSPGGNWSLDGDGGAYTDTTAILTISNATVNLNDVASTLELQLNGTTPGSGYDQVAIEGSGSLSNNSADLKFTLGFTPAVGSKFTIVKVRGTSSANNVGVFTTLNGVTTDLSQGATFVEPGTGKSLKISYRAEGSTFDAGAGNGNDIMLEVVPVTGPSLTWRGNGVNNNWDAGVTADWWNGTTLVTFNNGDNGTFDDTGSNNIPVNFVGELTPTTVTVNATKDYVFAGTGYFTNTVVLTKTNTGKLSIVTDNVNIGGTIIQRGILEIGTNGTTGTLSGSVSVNANGVLAFNHSDDKTISTPAFAGSGGFLHNGSGQLLITADMSPSFTGNTTNTGGLLQFGDGTGVLGQIGGTVYASGTNEIRYSFTGNANINNALGGNGTVTYENASGATLTLATTAVSSNFTGTNVLGAGVRLHAQNGSSFPFGNGSTVNVPSFCQAWCDTASYNNTFNIAGNGWIGVTPTTGAISVFGATFTGLINLMADARISGTISGGTIVCPITGGFQLEIWGNPGSYVLNMGPTNGVHSYASTLITSGTVRALNADAISTGPLTMDVAADLRLNGNNLTVASLTSFASGQVTGPGATIQNTHTNASATLTVGTDNSSTMFDGTFFNGGNGPLGLTKVGGGILTLFGINTNTGNVTVNGGTLAMSGSGSFGNASNIIVGAGAFYDVTAAGGTLTLNSGQTLGGSGTVNGAVIASAGSTIAPGASVGTLTVAGNITLGGNLRMELNRSLTPNSDRLVTSGGGLITGGGTLNVTNIGPVLQAGNTFQLFPAGVSGITANLQTVDSLNGATYTWQNNIAASGSITVATVTPIGQPTLNVSRTGNSLTFSWTGSYKLQSQTNSLSIGLKNSWGDYPGGGTSPVNVTIEPANPTVFFRLSP